MIWPMKAGSVLLGRDVAEANDRGVRRGADEVEGDEVLFPISELMISIDYERLLTWDKNCRQDIISYARIPPLHHTTCSQSIKLVKRVSFS
jgi:hypothetical protein